jgi:hypothetical protein
MIKVRRNGKEIFNASGTRPNLSFPWNTRLDCIEQDGPDVTVVLTDVSPEDAIDKVIGAERALIRHGHMIEAIKSYRERTGLGLKDSKTAIDTERASMIERGEYFPPRTEPHTCHIPGNDPNACKACRRAVNIRVENHGTDPCPAHQKEVRG